MADMNNSSPCRTGDIAICGMGMRLPGGIKNDRDLYEFLVSKGDGRSEIPQSRFSSTGHVRSDARPGAIPTKHGYFLNHVDLGKFDPATFSMTRAEIERLDPHQRLLLEVVRETFESAGEANFRGSNTGFFVGNFSNDWEDMQARDPLDHAPYQLLGRADFGMANRISYEYGLRGPSVTLKSACSSSGQALNTAVQSILSGECNSAIAAGANLCLTPTMWTLLSNQMTLSPDGSCKSFDASANGYARGEGVVALFLKPLSAAIRDGNVVRGVIRSIATNSDGKTRGITLPSADGQECLIRRCYAAAKLSLNETAMVECHGTGTAVGDPLEAEAVSRCFGDRGVYIGSVKPNLGHGEGVAALTSVVKAVVSLENKTLLPNINFYKPNPAISFEKSSLMVPTEVTAWPGGCQERISVNSFGIGGSNAHIIIDSAKTAGISNERLDCTDMICERHSAILLFSAGHSESLRRMTKSYKEYILSHPENLRAVEHTLANHRERMRVRAYTITNASDQFSTSRELICATDTRVAFVFTGQGAQWAHMGRELLTHDPLFAASVQGVDSFLQSLDDPPIWTVEGILREEGDTDKLCQADIAQPLCTAIQIGLVDMLRSWGFSPVAVIGHSSGEIAAAYAAGALNAHDAIAIAYYRGVICHEAPPGGAMAAVGMGRSQVTKFLSESVVEAAENTSENVTLSGERRALIRVLESIRASSPEVFVRLLKVPTAYHSRYMHGVGVRYKRLISRLWKAQKMTVPLFSSVSGRRIDTAEDLGPQYWQDNLENPVLFSTALETLLTETLSDLTCLEIGPHPALAGYAKQIFRQQNREITYLTTLKRGENDLYCILKSIGDMFCAGVSMKSPTKPGARMLADLPTYPWHYDQTYWSESRMIRDWRMRRHPPHDLLGTRVTEHAGPHPTWRNYLRISVVPWLRDHCVGQDIVFPAAAYIATAAEALFQLSDNREYTVRNVRFLNAMNLEVDSRTEIFTTLHRKSLTARQESRWYEFDISSVTNSGYVTHCTGLIASGWTQKQNESAAAESYARAVDPSRWYTRMAELGFNYGPRFTGLEHIRASVKQRKAQTTITDRREDDESPYSVHPCTLDLIIQSWIVASTSGVYRTLNDLFLPTHIKQLSVRPTCAKSMNITASAFGPSSTALGHMLAVQNGKMVVDLYGFEGTLIPINRGRHQQEGLHMKWLPDPRLGSLQDVMRPAYASASEHIMLERLFLLCLGGTHASLSNATSSPRHVQKYRDWISKQLTIAETGGNCLVDEALDIMNKEYECTLRQLQNCFEQARKGRTSAIATAMYRAYSNMKAIADGEIDYVHLLFDDDLMAQCYNWTNELSNLDDLWTLLGHAKPQLRLLEIGAGTGGSTAKILERLCPEGGERSYAEYTITDVSSGFFVQCKERFRDFPGITYKVLDISKDPLAQGFVSASFDLIVASNVIHATPNISESLRNCRKLLKPQGYLFLQELCPEHHYMDYIMGLFPGWWLGEDDGRVDQPYISPSEWDQRLRATGFRGLHACSLDNERPYHLNANMVSQTDVDDSAFRRVTLLTGGPTFGPLALQLHEVLTAKGFAIDCKAWGEDLPPEQDTIVLVDIERKQPLLTEVDGKDLQHLLTLTEVLTINHVLWLTPPAQINCKNPHAAQIIGFARSVRAELAMHFATVELNSTDLEAAPSIVDILERLQQITSEENDLDPDLEFAWHNGRMNIPRFHWFDVHEQLIDFDKPVDTKELFIKERGIIDSMEWQSRELDALADDHVQIRMSAAGINFHDLMVLMNIFDGPPELGENRNSIGLEGVGRIVKVGNQVNHVATGDRVIVIGINSTGFATDIQRPGRFCVKCPTHLTDSEAACLAIAYMTVLLAFNQKAHLTAGKSVLIHSAAGGIGIAAINVARWIGLEIYVTVGNDDKATFLTEEFGVPKHRIFYSRDATFADDIMRQTGNGVDAALNSLSGELLHETWKCIAPNGCMIELGKRDLVGGGFLDMLPFENNRSYFGIELSLLMLTDPDAVSRLLHDTVRLISEKQVKPIHPITSFDETSLTDAFRTMQKGTHIGRLVIKIPPPENLVTRMHQKRPWFRPEASYILVGGLGGLGKAIASWMVENGARKLLFTSRSAGKSDADQIYIQELQDAGCNVICRAGDITDEAFVQEVVSSVRGPIAGVLQMAMKLCDMGVLNMNIDNWSKAVRPKVLGTWNLHQALPDGLDFFVMFGSTGGTLGSYGQANYAAGNTFLDAFVQYRQSLGLAASVLDIGAVGEVGYVASTPGAATTMTAMAGRLIPESSFLDFLHLSMLRSSQPSISRNCSSTIVSQYYNPAQFVTFNTPVKSITDPLCSVVWRRDPRMALYRNNEEAVTHVEDEGSSSLKALLNRLRDNMTLLDKEESGRALGTHIAEQVAMFLMQDKPLIDISLSPTDIGMDSLVSIEVRNWWRQNFNTEVSILELQHAGTFEKLGQLATQRLKTKFKK